MKNNEQQERNVLILLRICTCLLAAVSFWATAQGMMDYTFPESWQAYAASLGIQGLLLGLNFSLPSFLKQCKDGKQKAALWGLTLVVLFCSSWFSYLFIAGQAYGESRETESRLLAQAAYRDELFGASTYTELYSQEMQNVLADQVVNLYQQALDMDQNGVDVSANLDWNQERERYAADNSAARDIMRTVIDAMENSTGDTAGQDAREQANAIISGMQSNLQSEIDRLGTQISDIDTRVATAETNLRGAENRLENAPDDVDITPYQNAVNQAVRTYDNLISRQNELVRQRSDYESALQRTTYYLTVLGMAEDGVSSYFVGTNLREIQRELFQASPDIENMLNLATDVFDRLQSAVDLDTNTMEYQNVLASMNSFLQNLESYSAIKASDTAIQTYIDDLASGTILSLEAGQNSSGWKSDWRSQFNDLKSKISGLPVYLLKDRTNSVLESFDRSASTRKLDQAIRRYLTDHNAAQAGLTYLISPYRGVALFSLFLAFLLDIAAFITGVIIDRVASKRKMEASQTSGTQNVVQTSSAPPSILKNSKQKWDIIPGLNQYIFLTGDHILMDGIMTYKAIENGEETEMEHPDHNLKSGFYLKNQGQLSELSQAVLLFQGVTGGPQDGIYKDCVLHYHDQLLTMTQSGQNLFLGPVGPYIPVYQLSQEQYEVFPAKNISDTHGREAVIALNKEGNRIAAIYVIE